MSFLAGALPLPSGCWTLPLGCWTLLLGCWTLLLGCWTLPLGCWTFPDRSSETVVIIELERHGASLSFITTAFRGPIANFSVPASRGAQLWAMDLSSIATADAEATDAGPVSSPKLVDQCCILDSGFVQKDFTDR